MSQGRPGIDLYAAEAAIAMLSCARIGAVHSVGFGASLRKLCGIEYWTQIVGWSSRLMKTTRGKNVPLKANVEKALDGGSTTIVVRRTGNEVPSGVIGMSGMTKRLDCFGGCERTTDAEDPLFILYTSGSTGKPKVLHHGGLSNLYRDHSSICV